MDTKTPKSKSGRPVQEGLRPDKKEDCFSITSVPIDSLILGGALPTEGSLIQKDGAEGLEFVTQFETRYVPEYDFHQVKLFVIDKNMEMLSQEYLLLDSNEIGKEIHKVLSISPSENFVIVEHLITKQNTKVTGYLENPDFSVIVGELNNEYILKRVLSGEIKESDNIVPHLEEEKAEVIKMTNDWLADESNQKMLHARAKKINNKFKNWFSLEEFSLIVNNDTKKSGRSNHQVAFDELNLLKLAGHILVKIDEVRGMEKFKVVFTGKQRLEELTILEEDYTQKLKEVQDAKRAIIEKSN